VDNCPAGLPAPDRDIIHVPAGTYVLTSGSLDSNGQPLVVTGETNGDCVSAPIIDAGGDNRALTIGSGNSANLVELRCLRFTNGYEDSNGGAIYFLSASQLWMQDIELDNNYSGTGGGGVAFCREDPSDVLIERLDCHDNTSRMGGGCIDSHIPYTLVDSSIYNNTNMFTEGGGIRQTDNIATLENTQINFNVGLFGGGIGLDSWQNNGSSNIVMLGGSLTDNTASYDGGNIYTPATGICDTCNVSLTNVLVLNGTAGRNGGNSFAGAGNKVELNGSSLLTDGTDTSDPFYHDCYGTVELYDTSSVSDPSGCNVVDNTFPPVCGDTVCDQQEDCSSCEVDCGPCSFCGDGTVDLGEECDDGNTTSNDGCSDQCITEMCVAWE